MAYFNYHAKAQKLITEDHCTLAVFQKEYHKISPVLLLYFDNNIPMPIREHSWHRYIDILSKKNIKIVNNLDM